MEKNITGNAHKFGDNINTDIISPPQYMELSLEEAAKYAMSTIRPEFASSVKQGDILVAEKNIGSGSSRETAPLTLKVLGIRAILAKSFARIFYRNCINLGMLALECSATDRIEDGDILQINYDNGVVYNMTKNENYACSKLPKNIQALIEVGGLVEQLKKEKVERK
ncbi:MAG: 3-isopropylmalate dehydratase small subunit [Peptoniphilaceae bacterium]|nr:3-isopropylmalate dehydratase small subunit [Peptoniphilaceae bacterium]